jgi:hypothetical protein
MSTDGVKQRLTGHFGKSLQANTRFKSPTRFFVLLQHVFTGVNWLGYQKSPRAAAPYSTLQQVNLLKDGNQ